ncbi:hypothetical protein FJY68_02035 [candidate division WOR-3 bacterium]|uniref:CobQ/CobB/MinD/ParA nucleotide binding domain-containing protein n=1 Tax=candidate division WOR-3 bacterium TaxID=2052148 RepID=A0A937XEH9_UNCW3|nr:hypothetical protein [candidate division WOR-3 bacterium]
MITRGPRTAGDGVAGACAPPDPGSKTAERVNWFHAEAFLKELRRISIFCGGFGSGKTEVAVNFTLRMRELGRRVSIADLDIVNLYFRSREVREQLRSQGVEVLIPGGALANADLPVIVPEVKGAIERREDGERRNGDCHQDTKARRGQSSNQAEGEGRKASSEGPVVVLDLGGDPAGARVMASIAEGMRPEDYSSLLVLNSRRPFTATVEEAERMMAGISAAAGINVDRIVVNSHLVEETTPSVIEEGIELGEALARKTGARIAFVAVQRAMLDRFAADKCRYPVMVLDRLMLKPWERSNWIGKYRVQQ